MNPIRIATVGQNGRMNREIRDCLDGAIVSCVGALRIGDPYDIVCATLRAADVALDFSSHTVTRDVLNLCALTGRPLVLGTTGHTEDEKDLIEKSALAVPIVWSSNFSTGVNALFWLTRKAGEILGRGFDLEVVEMHHRHKKDSPSGTAKKLAEILAEARSWNLDAAVCNGRVGLLGERPEDEIGIHSIRGGDVVGDHTVIFAAGGERVELTHKASSRETFVKGALRAAEWVVGKPPGLYDMQDVLGLRS